MDTMGYLRSRMGAAGTIQFGNYVEIRFCGEVVRNCNHYKTATANGTGKYLKRNDMKID